MDWRGLHHAGRLVSEAMPLSAGCLPARRICYSLTVRPSGKEDKTKCSHGLSAWGPILWLNADGRIGSICCIVCCCWVMCWQLMAQLLVSSIQLACRIPVPLRGHVRYLIVELMPVEEHLSLDNLS